MTNQPTTEQLAALKDYAKFVGKNWKEALQMDWVGSGPSISGWRGEWAYMQQLRNNFGSRWLASFELPTSEANQ